MLKEKHIIKAAGKYNIDDFNVNWIELWKGDEERRNWLRFFNYGTGFNVYLMSNEGNESIQLTAVSSWIKFKILTLLLK